VLVVVNGETASIYKVSPGGGIPFLALSSFVLCTERLTSQGGVVQNPKRVINFNSTRPTSTDRHDEFSHQQPTEVSSQNGYAHQPYTNNQPSIIIICQLRPGKKRWRVN